MVLPLIPVVIIVGTTLTGAGGVGLGTKGAQQIKRARADMKDNAAKYEFRYRVHEQRVEEAQFVFRLLGASQLRAQRDVIDRMKEFLVRHAKQVKVHEHLILEGVNESGERVVGLAKLDADVAGWVRGVVGSAVVSAAVPSAIRSGVMGLATAGTGVAISELSGAAAANATLAFVGGGTLASGGGGMALGATMLNVAAIGPTLLLAGIAVKNRGTKATTEAERHRTQVEVAIAELGARETLLRAARTRASEVDAVLSRLIADAVDAIDLLESEPFDMAVHAERFQRSLILVKAVRDMASAPILDAENNLDRDTEALVIRYREPQKEIVNV